MRYPINVDKYTVITAHLRLVRILHKCRDIITELDAKTANCTPVSFARASVSPVFEQLDRISTYLHWIKAEGHPRTPDVATGDYIRSSSSTAG